MRLPFVVLSSSAPTAPWEDNKGVGDVAYLTPPRPTAYESLFASSTSLGYVSRILNVPRPVHMLKRPLTLTLDVMGGGSARFRRGVESKISAHAADVWQVDSFRTEFVVERGAWSGSRVGEYPPQSETRIWVHGISASKTSSNAEPTLSCN